MDPTMMDHEEEPFDSNSNSSSLPNVSVSLPATKSKSGGAPPSAAFAHSGNGNGSAPVAVSPMENHRNESSLSNARSQQQQQQQQQTTAGIQRTNSNASSVTPSKPTGGYTNYSLYNTPSPDASRPAASQAASQASQANNGGLAPRQGYSFKRSESYDTNDLLRKYGGMGGPPRSLATPPLPVQVPVVQAAAPSYSNANVDVRGQALRVLDLVDDHLDTPLDVRRTQSGGFRAAPAAASAALDYPYTVRRTASGRTILGDEEDQPYSTARTGKRVPSALAGLSFHNSQQQQQQQPSRSSGGRMSYTDPRFKDDDEMSYEDEILRKVSEEDDFVDVLHLESRGASSRVNNELFAGDFPNKSWSSRYSASNNQSNQNQHSRNILDKNGLILDRFDQDNDRQRQSARNMFAASAYQVKNAMDQMGTKGKVFGSGFSFRQDGGGMENNNNHNHNTTTKPHVNLRTVWKDVDEQEDPTHPTTPRPVHKTWQKAMLNKRKRRRIIAAALLGLSALIIVIATSVNAANRNKAGGTNKATAGAIGSSVTFYVTSDVPYDQGEETKLNKDLANIAGDAEFIMHLGNIQDSTFMCPSTRYSDVASVLAKSPVPMFVVPGEEDWAKCPNPDKSLGHWLDAFVGFEERFKHPFSVYRHRERKEDFAMVHNGVLFFGLHLVNSLDHNDDLEQRQLDMLTFYFGMLNNQKDEYRAIVLMGNARPSPAQQIFFSGVFTSLKINKPIAYIHANAGTGQSVQEYTPFVNNPEIFGIEIQDGGKNPPLRITIGFGERPFLVG